MPAAVVAAARLAWRGTGIGVLDGRWRDLPLRELGKDQMNVMRPPLTDLTAFVMILLSLVGCRSTVTPLDERVSYWKAIVTQELPIESSREDIEAWAARRGIALTYTEKLHWLTGNLEDVVVPQEGPCDIWNIGVVVRLDDHSRSKKQTVGATKICQVLPPPARSSQDDK